MFSVKRFLTDITLKYLIFCVVLIVNVQRSALSKGFSANFANIRTFVGVNVFVLIQWIFVFEFLLANWAFVTPNFLMNFLGVSGQWGVETKTFSTQTAAESFKVRMQRAVSQEIGSFIKDFCAKVAAKELFTKRTFETKLQNVWAFIGSRTAQIQVVFVS